MKFCSKCGKELVDEAIVCPGCGCAVVAPQNNVTSNTEGDEVNVGLCVLAALIPLFGFIYWPLKHKETPKKAKACGITALVSWGVGILFSVLFSAVWVEMISELMYYL